MPAVIPFIPLIAAGVTGGTALVGAHMQSSAAKHAADAESRAANHAADVQARSAQEALDFQKQQAAHDAEVAETNRRANYDQWAAQQRRMGSVGEALGFGPRAIPDYVPMPGHAPTPGAAAPPIGSVGEYLSPSARPVTPPAPSGPNVAPPLQAPSPYTLMSVGDYLDPRYDARYGAPR
jgi:hypothetical protein